ncbi:MAG: hypothetical protein HN406_34415, partial [Lentisphaerae bacterium]|nr:hypothetical protein [Lentisphaerota bacterium]
MPSTKTIPHTFLVHMILVTAVSGALIGCLWTVQEYRRFTEEASAMRRDYMAARKRQMGQVVNRAVEWIQYKRHEAEERMRQSIKERAYEACAVASHIHEHCRGTKTLEEIHSLTHEALHSVRFNNGRGYYFAIGLDGVQHICPEEPEREGKNALTLANFYGADVTRAMLNLARTKGGGFLEHAWAKPGHQGTDHHKLSYVKHFEPFGWVIGTGEYTNDVEEKLQNEVLEWVQSIRFRNDGYVFVGQWDGYALAGPATGKNMIDVTDPNGVAIVRELIEQAKSGGGFVSYVMPRLETQRPAPKISYARGIPEWEWYVGTGLYVDDIEDAVAAFRHGRQAELWWNTVGICIVLGLLWLASYVCVHGANASANDTPTLPL